MIAFIRRNALPIVLFLSLLVLYLHNLSRSVYGGDVGDLVTAAFVGGVPHPPGYPLFSLLGFLLTRFVGVFQQTPAFMVGLISIFSSAGTVVLFFLISKKLTKHTLVSLIGALVLAFTYLFWFYAEIAEVFALNTFFAFLLLYLAFLYRETGKKFYLYFLAFFAGLSLTNHHTIIFLFPAVLYLVYKPLWETVKKRKRVLASCLLLGLLGLSVYLYIIFASLRHPIIDWANITDVQSFIDLITRKRYGTFQAGNFPIPPPQVRAVILKYYFIDIVSQLTLPVFALSLVGGIVLFLKKRAIAIALIAAFFLTGPFFITYAGFPLSDSYRFGVYERFLSLSASLAVLFLPVGLLAFTQALGRFFTKPVYVVLFQLIFLLIPLQLFIYNFPKTNLSNVWDGDTLGFDELRALPKNSVLFLSGDTNLFNTWYVRYARGFRPDTMVLNPLAPDTTNRVLSSNFTKMKSSSDNAQQSVKNLSQNVAQLNTVTRVFSDLQMVGPNGEFSWVPYGMAYRLLHSDEKKPDDAAYKKESSRVWSTYEFPKQKLGSLAQGSFTISDIPMYYSNGMLMTGNYFHDALRDNEMAESYYQSALRMVPDNAKAMVALGVLYWTDQHNCSKGIGYLENAMTTDPTEKRFYQLVYIAYKNCNVAESKQKALLTSYYQQFGTSLTVDLKKESEDAKNKE
jgi:hypothetical protein